MAFNGKSHHNAKYGDYGVLANGSRVNQRTYDAILTAAKISKWGSVRFTQGGLNNNAVVKSAQTHNGLDVADIAVDHRSRIRVNAFISALMQCGGVGFHRDQQHGNMAEHVHIVMWAGNYAHESAHDQIIGKYWSFDHGGAGLEGAKSAKWWGPKRITMHPWSESKYNPNNAPGYYHVDQKKVTKEILGTTATGKVVQHRPPNFNLKIVKFVWEDHHAGSGRIKYGVTQFGTRYAAQFLARGKYVAPPKPKPKPPPKPPVPPKPPIPPKPPTPPVPPKPPILTPLNVPQMRELAAKAGFTGVDLDVAAAIAMAESSGRYWVENSIPCVGLWQINFRFWNFHQPTWTKEWLKVPANNAQAAFYVYSQANKTFRDWTTFTSGSYKRFMPTP